MTTLTITAKGQVTLRQELLKHLGVSPGQKIEVDMLPDGKLCIKGKHNGTLSDFIGCLSQVGQPTLSTDDMNNITGKAWAGEA